MKLSIILPVYNEEDVIVQTLHTLSDVLSKLSPEIIWDIVVADNGSTDKTKQKVENIGIPKVRLLSIPEKGKGIGVITAARQTDADFFGFIDADLSAEPESIIKMLEILQAKKADIVVGSRLIDNTKVHRGLFRTATSRLFNFLQRMILGLNINDTQCGLKIMNKEGARLLCRCEEKTWFFDIEFLSLAVYNGLKVFEFPVFWEEFRYQNRKTKLNVMRDGFAAIVAMFRIRHRLQKIK